MTTPLRLDLALIDADAAVQYDPTNWQAWLQQGETLLKMGDGEGAEESLLNAVQFAQGANKLTAQKSLAEVRVRRTGQPPAAEQPAPSIQSKSPVAWSTSELPIRAPPAPSILQPPKI
jgi:tetratricopeptide (TPR) repeat protein